MNVSHQMPAGLTRNQSLVLSALSRANAPLSAYTILDQLREEGVGVHQDQHRCLEEQGEGEEAPHVAARSNSSRAHLAAAHVHWATPVVPRHPDALEDGIENVLALVATCQPHESALAIWESALRQRVVDVELLRRLNLPPAARRMLAPRWNSRRSGRPMLSKTPPGSY